MKFTRRGTGVAVVIAALLIGQPAAADGLLSKLKASLMGSKPRPVGAPTV